MLIRTLKLNTPEDGGIPAGGGSAPAPVTPAPSSSPSTAAPAASSTAPSTSGGSAPDDAFDFGAFVDAHESGDDAAAVKPQTPTAAPVVAAPAAAPVVPPVVAPVVVPAAVTPPPTEPQVAQPVATAPPPASEAANAPPQQVNWEEHRKTFLPKLQEMYKMSDQEIQDFQTNPGEAIPKLAAELHYKVMMALHSSMMEMMPHAIASETKRTEASTKYEKAFYDKFPQLKAAVDKDQKAEDTINQAIKAFRVANPKASMDDLIKNVGLLSMLSLGINPLEGMQQVAPQVVPVVQAQIPGRPAGVAGSAHAPVRQHGAAPGEQTDAELYGDIANWHLGGGN